MLDSEHDRLQSALYKVDVAHQFHGSECLCGFQSDVARRRTEHITTAVAELLSPSAAHPMVTAVRDYLDNAGITSETLRYAATHEALCRSWIFDLLTGLADTLDSPTRPGERA